MSMDVGSLGGVKGTSGVSAPETMSLQRMYAQLQMQMAAGAKDKAMSMMGEIQDAQKEQQEVSALLNQAREAQLTADNDDKCTAMSKEMIAYMDKNGLAYDKAGKDHLHDKDEWNSVIASLEGKLESIGTDTQQKMVFIQDYMGQYNSYLQGASSQLTSGNETLKALARG